MQPVAFWPAIFLIFIPPVWMLDRLWSSQGQAALGKRLRLAAALGWFWGFGYFVAGLWWLGKAFLVEADQFAWAMPFGVLGLPAVLAVFPALAFAAACLLWSRSPARILAFTFMISAAEWLRGHLFTGFPWNTPGMAFGNHLVLMQGASLIGLYGLTILVIFIGSAPATLIDNGSRSRKFSMPAMAVVLLAIVATGGYMRVPPMLLPLDPSIRLRILQPNVPQDANFNSANGEAILDGYLALSRQPTATGALPTHYIWPESAFPFLLHRNLDALDRIAELLRPNNAYLITGAARMGPPLPGEEAGTFFNAIQAIDSNGIIRDTYDKVHLVPFGEYEPAFSKTLLRMTGLHQFVSIPGGFTPADIREPFNVPGLPPLAGSICYEAIFPGAVLPPGGDRPGVIVNVTNDAWFGDSPGPYQHFAQARLRSVEEGLPLIRAANSGISAIVDPYGRVLMRSGLNEATVLDFGLPLPLLEPTFFSRWRDLPFAVLLTLCFIGAFFSRRREIST